MLSRLLSSETPKQQPNIIFLDPCGRSFAKLYRPLKKKGYQIRLFNLMDMEHSNFYNPLASIVHQAKLGSVNNTEQQCDKLSDIIFNSGNDKQNSYFYSMAKYFFNAIVYYKLAYAIFNNDWHRISIFHVLHFSVRQTSISKLINQITQEISKLKNKKHKSLKLQQVFKFLVASLNDFKESIISKETAGSVYSTFLDNLRNFQQPVIAQTTSKQNEFNFDTMSLDKLLTVRFKQNSAYLPISARIYNNTYQFNKPAEFYKSNTNHMGIVKIPLTHKIDGDTIYVKLTIHNSKTGISYTALIKLQKNYLQFSDYMKLKQNYRNSPILNNLRITPKGEIVNQYTHRPIVKNVTFKIIKDAQHIISQFNILYNPYPTAWFLIIPPNNIELNMLCTMLLTQYLTNNANNNLMGCHPQRHTNIYLDSLQLIPRIANLSMYSHDADILMTGNEETLQKMYGIKYLTNIIPYLNNHPFKMVVHQKKKEFLLGTDIKLLINLSLLLHNNYNYSRLPLNVPLEFSSREQWKKHNQTLHSPIN